MSNFNCDLTVEHILKCPVCYDVPKTAIFLCDVGHHVCENCSARLTTCPTCRSSMTGTRCYLAEALIAKVSELKGEGVAPWNNNDVGLPRLKNNMTELKPLPLPEGVYTCKLGSCRNRTEMGVGDLFAHIRSTHSYLFAEFRNKPATFTTKFDGFCFMKSIRSYNRAFHVTNMGLLWLNIKVSDSFIHCWLSRVGPVHQSDLFQYEVEFSKAEDSRRLTFVSDMASSLHTFQWLLARGRVFVIPPTSHSLENGHLFSFTVKIVYKNAAVKTSPQIVDLTKDEIIDATVKTSPQIVDLTKDENIE